MKFRTKTIISFIVIIGFVVCFGGFVLYQINQIKQPLANDIPQSIDEIKKTSKLDSLSQSIRYYDEVLTQSARNYAFTGDKKWEDRYRAAEPQLDKIIKEAISEGDAKDKEFFSSVDSSNEALVKLEYKSLDLVDKGDNKDAISILESKEYADLKKIYDKGVTDYTQSRGKARDDALIVHTQRLENTILTIQRLFDNSTQSILFVIITSIPCAILIWMLILRGLILRIGKLSIATKDISAGKLDVSLDMKGDDEMSELSSSFSDMAKSLKESKSRLYESEFKYRQLYDSSPVLLRTIDENGIIRDCNQTYAEVLGFSKSEVIGKSIYDHIPAEHTDTMKNSFKEWKQTGVIKNREVWLLKKDGTSFPVILNANNLYDEYGNLIGSNTVMRDMSEIFSAKREIEDLRTKRLTVIGELSARIAHDMRNPLSVLKNSMKLVRMRISEQDEGLLNNLAMAQRAISRMSHQIEEVLDYVTPEPLHLVDETLSKILKASLQKSHLPEDVTINLPSNEVKIVCDPKKMEIVFINLITNAVQAMDNKGRIDVRANYDKDYVVIDLEDTGTGIPEHLMSKIFDPLFTTRQIGTGLGLPSIKSIIEKHGGTVHAKNSAGNGGALFTIKLPRSIC